MSNNDTIVICEYGKDNWKVITLTDEQYEQVDTGVVTKDLELLDEVMNEVEDSQVMYDHLTYEAAKEIADSLTGVEYPEIPIDFDMTE